jgi:cytoskeletal protein CcmA (bactofilin family)
MSSVSNYFNADSRIEGRIYLEGMTAIDGCVNGELTTTGDLFIGE